MTRSDGTPKEWDAAAYHRISEPQFAWGLRVLERLSLRGDERVLDAGCGSGRLTVELARRLPRGKVVGCDLSENMTRAAARTFVEARSTGASSTNGVCCANLLQLPFHEAFDVVFSTATFHWVLDHQRLFDELRSVLRSGGRLEAQCGGGPNLRTVHDRALDLLTAPPYSDVASAWEEPWEFASPDATGARLRQAGFYFARCWLEAAPARFADASGYREFLEKVVMRPFLAHIPDATLRARFLDELTAAAAADDPPLTLDYWRLNISATV